MKPYALVIVDMQPGFSAENYPQEILNIQKEILRAKRFNCPIIVLEYDGFDDTIDSLKFLLDDYHLTFYRTKNDDDGSLEVLEELSSYNARNNVKISSIHVCGINMEYCVFKTATGLADKSKKLRVTLKTDCCNTNTGSWKKAVEYVQRANRRKNLVVK